MVSRWRIHLQCGRCKFHPLGREDSLEEEMATHSSMLTWKVLRTEEPGGLQPMGLQRVRRDWVTKQAIYLKLSPSFLWAWLSWFLTSDIGVSKPLCSSSEAHPPLLLSERWFYSMSILENTFLKFILWLLWVLVTTQGVFLASCRILCCSAWAL